MESQATYKQPGIKIQRCCDPGCKNITDGAICRSCKKSLCESCYKHTITRASNIKFYIPYQSYCDTCIWFDIG